MSSALLDPRLTSGDVELDGNELRIPSQRARYAVEEAAHVLAEVTGALDRHDLVGTVRPLRELAALGAELLERSMVIGDFAYDIEPGFLIAPLGRPGDRAKTLSVLASLADPAEKARTDRSDEALLARYLIERL